ncbi:MAG: hypothetical protein LC795_20920 [Acidobacteria bacterium]|nr:hypothetical protein [Acidobacteriota bacterium]
MTLTLTPGEVPGAAAIRLSPPMRMVAGWPGTTGTATVESWKLAPVPMKLGLMTGVAAGTPTLSVVVDSAPTVTVPASDVMKDGMFWSVVPG